jgi:hypothetical protein
MKRLVLAAGTVALLASAGTALTAGTIERVPTTAHRPMPALTQNTPLLFGAIPGKSSVRTQTEYYDLFQPDVRPFYVNYLRQPSIAYDAKTNLTVVYRSDLTFGTDGGITGGYASVYTTTDDGATWTENNLNNSAERASLFGTLALVNPENGVSNADALPWLAYGVNLEVSTAQFAGGAWTVFDGNEITDFTFMGPDENNQVNNEWSLSEVTSSNSPAAVYGYGLLSPQSGVQYGTYGVWGFDMDAIDFTASTIPSIFTDANFRPSTAVASSYQAPMYGGTDADGRLYTCANNIFADDQENRVVAIATSDDQGATWSSWNRMPAELWDTYATGRGGDNGYSVLAYEQDAFAVTGPNKCSYITRAAVFSGTTLNSIDIVEVKYDNGSWSIVGIAALALIPDTYERERDLSQAQGKYVIEQMNNYNGNETELAITGDGKLLLKFIDAHDANWIKFDPPVEAYRADNQGALQPITVDSMLTTDVYMIWRDIAGGDWSEGVNVTNDMKFDKGTHMPRNVKSLSSIPLIYHQGLTNADITNTSSPLYQKFPDLILESMTDAGNTVRATFINALNPSSVSELEPLNFSLGTVNPNPVTTTSEVVFTLEQPGMVKLAVYDALGNTVATLLNGTMDAGVHGATIDASSFPAGSYQYALTVNGRTASQALVVIR